ncbi:MAG: hydroxyacid dehydrogenase [Candidatus Marinimicrobia bacterium]|nr:hydroxyacid dehydrogenase [Candidatus Neomarinimicrobiota bacterium]
MKNGLFVMNPGQAGHIFPPDLRARLEQMDVVVPARAYSAAEIEAEPSLLGPVDLLFGSWGMPRLTAELLAGAPRLEAVFYAAGSVRGWVTEALWQRGIPVCSAWGANAVPVAEYTVAMVTLALKQALPQARAMRRERSNRRHEMTGAYQSTVGLVSMGMIAQLVRERLRAYDLQVVAYDPYLTPAQARALGITLLPLDDVFARSDVVSIHTPWLKETENLVGARQFARLKTGATLINTARGAVLNEPELCAALAARPDVYAVLDVTWPEPPRPDSPLYELPNVWLTPHIAGSAGNELARMGAYMVDECERLLSGQPLCWRLTQEQAAIMA